MKKLLLLFLAVLIIIFPSNAWAGTVRVDNAHVQQLLVHGSTFVVFFDKTAGGCEKMSINTVTRQADRAFQILLSAFETGALVDYAMDPDSRSAGSSGLTCQMRYVSMKKD